jgi:hypothetical protein
MTATPTATQTPSSVRRWVGLVGIRVAIFALCLAFLLLLRSTYYDFIVPDYAYQGFAALPSPVPEGWLYAIALLPCLWIPLTRRPSIVLYWFLYLSVVAPSATLPCHWNVRLPGGPLGHAVTFVALFGMLGLVYALPAPRRDRRPAGVSRVSVILLGGAIVAFYVTVFLSYGWISRLPSLDEVYDVRLEFADTIAAQGRIVSYTIPWLGNVINPLIIAWGVQRRNPFAIAAGAAGSTYLYGLGGYKSIASMIVFVPILFVAARYAARYLGIWMVIGAIGILVATRIEAALYGSTTLAFLLVRRIFGVPAMLTSRYFEFFSDHPKALLGHSFLRGFVPANYSDGPPSVIGRAYVAPDVHANANLWADGYANFGLAGSIGATLLLIVVLIAYDWAAAGADPTLPAVLMGMPALALSNAALFTTILTHGLGLATVVVWLLPGVPTRTRTVDHIRAPPASRSPP